MCVCVCVCVLLDLFPPSTITNYDIINGQCNRKWIQQLHNYVKLQSLFSVRIGDALVPPGLFPHEKVQPTCCVSAYL